MHVLTDIAALLLRAWAAAVLPCTVLPAASCISSLHLHQRSQPMSLWRTSSATSISSLPASWKQPFTSVSWISTHTNPSHRGRDAPSLGALCSYVLQRNHPIRRILVLPVSTYGLQVHATTQCTFTPYESYSNTACSKYLLMIYMRVLLCLCACYMWVYSTTILYNISYNYAHTSA